MWLKKGLKKIFPPVFLKKAFITYNTIKIHTADKLFFPEYIPGKEELVLYKKQHPFIENNIQVNAIHEPEVLRYMKQWYDWTQEEFIVKVKDCLIEPDQGWGMCGRKLNYFSLGISRTPFLRKPNLIKLLLKKPLVKIDKAISLRDTGEENYFHFYNDVLSKIFFLKNQGHDIDSYALIISSRLWSKKYFQYYINNSAWLKGLKWHIQDQEFIRAGEIIFCKPLTHRKELFQNILSAASLAPVTNGKERKVFLKRNRKRLRYIENDIEVEQALQELGFEIVDADTLEPEAQISLFRETRWLVGIHGAGLTNIMYRAGNPLSVLEIFPPPAEGYLPFHYIMLSQMFGFCYQAIIGDRSEKKFSGGIHVDKEKLRQETLRLLQDK